ncbi:hypothetical protein HF290_04775 [Acidithiobacillus ferrooxidans]|uniref:hypothetical protein n=1 Tax=Acidithiobacillus ferrooxidans TaxID=920 RepID=UPI001C066D7F|nr:hypothetical protein [Acidithiobacillus ferrooxidans]MBU2859746.1 hypothetical protein [Acidithiobacillus ferrooxidans]
MHLTDQNAVIADRVSDRDVVIASCHGKHRSDKVLRVVTLEPGTPYRSITAPNVLEHLDTVPYTDKGLASCVCLVDALAAEYAKEHPDDEG